MTGCKTSCLFFVISIILLYFLVKCVMCDIMLKGVDFMKLIICVDDNFGMMFNNRRQSQDRVLREKIIEVCKNHVLWMNDYSSRQFQNGLETIVELKDKFNCDIKVDNDMLDYISDDDYCFLENVVIDEQIISSCSEIVIAKWNREYPSDMYFNLNYLNAYKLCETYDFEGYSHEKITIERYVKS